MNTLQRRIPVLIMALLIAMPLTLLADEPETSDREARIIIIDDEGDERIIAMDGVHEIVAEAMGGLEEALAELEDMQLQVRLGKDNRLDFSFDDKTVEVDLDQIMTQVAQAAKEGFDMIQTDEWAHSHDRWTDVSEDDLRQELEDLQKEMKELRREIRKIKNPD